MPDLSLVRHHSIQRSGADLDARQFEGFSEAFTDCAVTETEGVHGASHKVDTVQTDID